MQSQGSYLDSFTALSMMRCGGERKRRKDIVLHDENFKNYKAAAAMEGLFAETSAIAPKKSAMHNMERHQPHQNP